jgi:hypothetical protein
MVPAHDSDMRPDHARVRGPRLLAGRFAGGIEHGETLDLSQRRARHEAAPDAHTEQNRTH